MRAWSSQELLDGENLPDYLANVKENRQKVKGSLLPMLFADLAPDLPKAKLFLNSGIQVHSFFKTFPFFVFPVNSSTYSILYFC